MRQRKADTPTVSTRHGRGCHTDWPFVSVIIPMRNEEHAIGACLDSILASTYPERFEILIVDGISDDDSTEVVSQYKEGDSDIHLLSNPDRIQAAAMNIGIFHARGDIVLRMDAHATYPPDYIRNCVDLLITSGADNVGGVQAAVGQGRFGQAVAAAMNSRFGAGDAKYRTASKAHYVDSVILGAWRKETLIRLGGFRQDWAGNEDYELNIRLRAAGGRVLFDPSIRYRYGVRESPWALAKQYRTHGFYKARTLREYPDTLRWRQMAPPVMVAALIASPLAAVVDWRLALIPVGVYGLGLAMASVLTARRRGWSLLPFPPAVFATMHMSWGLGFWHGVTRWGPPMIGPGRIFGALRRRDQRA